LTFKSLCPGYSRPLQKAKSLPGAAFKSSAIKVFQFQQDPERWDEIFFFDGGDQQESNMRKCYSGVIGWL